MRLRRLRRVAVRDARLRGDPLHDLLVAVGLVHRRHVLEDRRAALEAEAGVDVLRGKRGQRAVRVLLVLHEHEVPELEVALAARAADRAVRLPAAVLLAAVVVELRVRARTAPARRPTRSSPRAGQRDDPLGRHADLLPELDRDLVRAEPELRVARVDGRPHAIPVELHPLAHELGGELDRPFLEVLPEREVAEHLEERERALVADLVDVGRAEALLRGDRQRRRRRLEAEEVRHLRLHPGRRQERRAVVRARNERGRGHAQVPLLLEEGEKALAQLRRRPHPRILRAGSSEPAPATPRAGSRPAASHRPRAAPRRARPRAARRPPSRRSPPPRRRAATSGPRLRARSRPRGR